MHSIIHQCIHTFTIQSSLSSHLSTTPSSQQHDTRLSEKMKSKLRHHCNAVKKKRCDKIPPRSTSFPPP